MILDSLLVVSAILVFVSMKNSGLECPSAVYTYVFSLEWFEARDVSVRMVEGSVARVSNAKGLSTEIFLQELFRRESQSVAPASTEAFTAVAMAAVRVGMSGERYER